MFLFCYHCFLPPPMMGGCVLLSAWLWYLEHNFTFLHLEIPFALRFLWTSSYGCHSEHSMARVFSDKLLHLSFAFLRLLQLAYVVFLVTELYWAFLVLLRQSKFFLCASSYREGLIWRSKWWKMMVKPIFTKCGMIKSMPDLRPPHRLNHLKTTNTSEYLSLSGGSSAEGNPDGKFNDQMEE